MKPEVWILLSGALTFGVPLVLAARELLLLRRGGDDRYPRSHRPPDAPPPPSPPPAGVRLLPDCLIPKPAPKRTARKRMLEDA